MFWKLSFVILLIALVVSNVMWFTSAMDAGLSNTQKKESFDNQSKNVKVLRELLLNYSQGSTQDLFLKKANQLYSRPGVVVEKENSIYVHLVEFQFEKQELKAIKISY